MLVEMKDHMLVEVMLLLMHIDFDLNKFLQINKDFQVLYHPAFVLNDTNQNNHR